MSWSVFNIVISKVSKHTIFIWLPGALIAGIGIGLTSTPVTGTSTGSVSADRPGIASGIDVSARLITLAVNIAVMGFVLVEGVLSLLKQALPALLDPAQLGHLAEGIASGSITSLSDLIPQASGTIVHDALTQGFGWVMLYGGIGVWILALTSFAIFNAALNPRSSKRAEVVTHPSESARASR